MAALVLQQNTPAVGATTTPSPAGLFVQVSTLAGSPAAVARWLDRLCRGGTRELVLADVAAADGALATSYLDVIVPRLPGGSESCFQRAFVGSALPPWRGPGALYTHGVRDPAYRQQYLALSRATIGRFTQRYPHAAIDWYLSAEANLNALYDTDLGHAYQSLLTAQLKDLDRIRPGRGAMWSPAFWYPYGLYRANDLGMGVLRQHLTQLLVELHGAGLRRIDLQDFVGGSYCQPAWNQTSPADAVGWVRFLHSLGTGVDVRVNVERFRPDCSLGGLVAAPGPEITARELFYRTNGVVLGAEFELRYWAVQAAAG